MAQWDAFISYARSASTLEAQRLQTAIQTFAKPWYRLRAVRIFRDDSSMSANPALWSSIEQGLQQARWLVVLLSQAAAGSEYVAAEIQWWLRHKDASTILLVHDDGTLAWDRQRNDFSAATDCVPAPLRGAFREEPRWTDLSWFDAPGSSGPADPRFAEKVADLAATIRGIPRDELLGEDVSQHKRSWRLAKFAIGALSLLLIASVVASIIAIAQRNQVQRQATALLARQLAATADSLLGRDLRRAQLLSVRAYRTDPNAETRAALLRATLASPALRRFLTFDSEITALSASQDGRFVAVGLENGQVYSWDVATSAPVSRLTLTHSILDVDISNDGRLLAAVDGTSTYVATGTDVGSLVVPAGQSPVLITVSGSGNGLLIASKGDAPMVTLVDLAQRSQRTVPDPTSPAGYGSLDVQFTGNDTVVMVGGGSETRTFPAFARISRGEDFYYGNRQIAGRLSGDGQFATATNGASEVPVWKVAGSQADTTRYAVIPMTNQTASALNHDGTLLAVADATGIHVATVRETSANVGYGHSIEPPTSYDGIGEVNYDGLLFLGTSPRFVAAAGADLSLWDPNAAGRSSSTASIDIGNACTACGSPTVAVSPDGSTMAVREGERSKLVIGSVPGRSGSLTASYSPTQLVGEFAPPVWLDDRRVLQLTPGQAEGVGSGLLPALPPGVTGWAIGRLGTRILDLRLAVDGSSALVVGTDGHLGRYDPRTGALQSEATMALPVSQLFDAAIDEGLTSVAITAEEGPLVVVDAATGAQKYAIDQTGEDVSRALFSHGSLWIRYNSGLIERRDATTGTLQRTLPGRLTVTQNGRMAAGAGLVAIPTDIGIGLYDAASDAFFGTVGLPAGRQNLRRGVTLGADGSVLVTVFESSGAVGSKGLAVSTDLRPEELVAAACRTSGGSLSAADWQALIGPDVPSEPHLPVGADGVSG